LYLSNTRRLVRAGWTATLLEAHPWMVARGRDQGVIHATVTPGNVDDLLLLHGCPARPDLGVIDIDGNDYWVWRAMTSVRPRVMCVEFKFQSQGLPATVPRPDAAGPYTQATCAAIVQLAIEKGYTPLALTPCNLLCVDAGA